MLNEGTLYLLAIVSGISFSLIGVALRLGTDRGLHPLHLVAVSSLLGTVVFGAQSPAVFGTGVPFRVIVLGIAAGLSQYGVIHLVKAALHMGPLSPLWCALMLGFVPVILYSGLYRGEPVGAWQSLAIAAAVACVLVASLGKRREEDTPESGGGNPGTRWWLYGVVLLAILVVNSFANVCIKDLGMEPAARGGTLWNHYDTAYFALLYFLVHVSVMTDLVVARRIPRSVLWMLGLGALAGVGSMGGMWLLGVCIELPAAALFTVNAVSSILFTAFVGAVWFREERTWNWYATIGTAVLVVVLAYLGIVSTPAGT